MVSRKEHWENVYLTKQPHELSWTQELPKTSVDLIRGLNIEKSASIIDVGGGDSKLVDYLLEEGFENITVLDISEQALKRAKERLGIISEKVKWIVSDVLDFNPPDKYDVWHDRATFHFLTNQKQVQSYLDIAGKAVNKYIILGTFSDKGPQKCSGLDVCRYSEHQLEAALMNGFEKIKCLTEDHLTPFKTVQNFLFCVFMRS